MKLTDSIIKAAKPKDKRYNLADGKGLVLLIQPDGQKAWRMRYYFNENEICFPLASIPLCR
ncbi:integrase arm-type DNA-binding domain-containing protein [Nitrosomonas sp. Is35]|uniref:integrase arm-type DNA-binding domain-containing protein n=1 Tax=Nitrosomonas sp. Is35 TaxID=3080534 RepID=UPI00398219E3